MPFQPPSEALAILKRLNSNYRLVHTGPSYIENKEGKPIADPAKPGGISCEIIDETTGEIYARAPGPDESTALLEAARAAVIAPKPMTKAQRATKGEIDAAVAEAKTAKVSASEAQAEAARLRAELAALKQQMADAKEAPPADFSIKPPEPETGEPPADPADPADPPAKVNLSNKPAGKPAK